MTEEVNETVVSKKKEGFFSGLINWATGENYTPIIFSNNCCSSIANLMDDDQTEKILDFEAAKFENNTADLLIIHGPVNEKRLESIHKAYEQLSGKKYVLGLGACITANSFLKLENCKVGIEELIPFDLIIPACGVSSETVLGAIRKLKDIR